MRCVIPEISYHNRDPVLSLDFQPRRSVDPAEPLRLATAGSDCHVVIFSVVTTSDTLSADDEADGGETTGGGGGKVELECLCDLTRHQKSVNIVRWSPDGNLLASGDDESVIILWQLKPSAGAESSAPRLFDDDTEDNKENWVVYKMIRSHLDDVYDLAWSPCSQFLLSGSVDNSAIVTNVHKNQKVAHLSDSQGFVQGVAWNPKHPVLATLSSDRKCRFYNSATKKIISKTYKALLNMPVSQLSRKKKGKDDSKSVGSDVKSESKPGDEVTENKPEEMDTTEKKEVAAEKTEKSTDKKQDGGGEEKQVRLFHDDTFKGFFRRLAWSMDGELLVVPSGVIETDSQAKVTHCTYVFTRLDLSKPAVSLPTQEKYTIAAKFCPVTFKLRPQKRKGVGKGDNLAPWEKYQTVFALPYRMVYAVATQNAVMIYDTQQACPIARVSNIHYTGLTDLSWSPDGTILFVSSTDGFCSIITFAPGELGEVYTEEEAKETSAVAKNGIPEAAGKSHLDNANSNDSETAEIKDKEGFNEHGLKSPAHVRIKSSKEGGKSNPKRLKFITLKSPKAKVKHPVSSEIHDENGVDVGELVNGKDLVGDGGIEGIVPMEEDTLNLQLDETQPANGENQVANTSSEKAKSESEGADKTEKKRVPLISVPNGASNDLSNTSSEDKQPTVQKKRVELITLSKPLSQ